MVLDTSAGFRPMGRLYGALPYRLAEFVAMDDETLTKGDIGNLESGEIDLAATADTALVGPIMETQVCVDSTTLVKCIADPDVIMAVYDANVRVPGETLDLTGATGAQALTTSANKEFIVIADSAADELTLVVFNKHAFFPGK
jgi:hypothetical protein